MAPRKGGVGRAPSKGAGGVKKGTGHSTTRSTGGNKRTISPVGRSHMSAAHTGKPHPHRGHPGIV